ncbi:MAG: pitrilysin family protein [Propionibacteriaceae bacterium]|nr:insulinase family protein [Micropruina sp.]HBY23582.1 hypothetical protein [Propionibacteriaceae bacterium]
MAETDRPAVERPGPFHTPAPVESRLDNGLRVLTFQRPGQHVASVGLVLDLPLILEPRDREGVATLCVRTLDEGTRTHPSATFAEVLEDQGAVMSGSAGYGATTLGLSVAAREEPFAAALALFAEAVLEPEFGEDEVARQREIRIAQYEQQQVQPAQRATAALRETLIDKRYRASRPAGGTTATVSSVTAVDVRAFHADHYVPHLATLVVAGDFSFDPLPAIRAAFGCWSGPHVARPAHESPDGGAPSVLVIDRPGAVQADVRYGWRTIDRTDHRWASLQVACYALGGAFLSRLNAVLREEKGYTYGVHLTTGPGRHGALSVVQGSFRSEVAADAIGMIQPLIDVSSRPFTSGEVDSAVTFITGVTPLRLATADGLVDQVATLAAVDLPLSFVDDYLAALADVTPASATEAAVALLPPKGGTLVVVGDAATLVPTLTEQGWAVTVQDAED